MIVDKLSKSRKWIWSLNPPVPEQKPHPLYDHAVSPKSFAVTMNPDILNQPSSELMSRFPTRGLNKGYNDICIN